ncbi:MAG TPA: hypothetical protein VLN45_10230, partial [Ignavibacteriaceae bacterium]|nr:hypothetical protein [Ignavibacteriaceae bacterium]
MFRSLQASIIIFSLILFFSSSVVAQNSLRHRSSSELIIQNHSENNKSKIIDESTITSDTVLFDSFDNMNNWTIVGPLGFSNWHIQNSNFALGVSSPELDIKWTPIFIGDSYILSPVFVGLEGHNLELTFHDYLTWWADSMIVGVATTNDGGNTYNTIWELIDTVTYGPAFETINFIGVENMQLALYYTGNSNNIDDWFVDDLLVRDLSVVPVELTSFTAAQNGIKVILKWITGSETNNHGFEIEKRELRNGQETVWEKIAFVEG